MTTQLQTHRCDCGAQATVTQETAYEFPWLCACGRAGIISWAHARQPPQFTPQAQGELFPTSGRQERTG